MLENFVEFFHTKFDLNDSVNIETVFIALAMPSMEGKTQSSFAFRRVKPLYFPLSGIFSDQSTQLIQI